MTDTLPQGPGWWQASDGRWYPPTASPGPSPYFPPPPPGPPCEQCGRPRSYDKIGCEFCGQVRGLPVGVSLTAPGRRLGQYLLELLLVIVTLVVGWIIWSLIVWSKGQTPAMTLLHVKVVKLETGSTATWGTMFLREFVGKGLVGGLISGIFFPAWVVLALMLLWDQNRQELWDKIAGTIVVNDLRQEAPTVFVPEVPEVAS